jgi:NADH-quinone oxidoreductase subunit C
VSKLALDKLAAKFASEVIETHDLAGDDTAVVKRARIKEICRFLRDDPELRFDFCMDLTAVDFMGREPRFDVVYHLYSTVTHKRLRLRAGVPEEDCRIDTVVDLWPTADWLEREAWDLYGIKFDGHPDLRRILLYEEFVGHPLRKDYPKEKRQPLVRREMT